MIGRENETWTSLHRQRSAVKIELCQLLFGLLAGRLIVGVGLQLLNLLQIWLLAVENRRDIGTVRGGATNPAETEGTDDVFGAASVGMATATLARPLAALSAAITQARTCGLALARHASRLPAPPLARIHACTIGLPTVIRQFSMAASFESANADPLVELTNRPTPSIPQAPLDQESNWCSF